MAATDVLRLWLTCVLLVTTFRRSAHARQTLQSTKGCTGLVESGVRWDVVRTDLTHIVQAVLEGALSRDLLAAKDSGGRDPAVSYGDVQLQRHLERIQKLVHVLPGEHESACLLGRHLIRIFVSAMYSGLSWETWFEQYREDFVGVVQGSNWTEAITYGWPVLDILTLIAELHGNTEVPSECGDTDLDFIIKAIDAGKDVKPADFIRGDPCPFVHAVVLVASATQLVSARKPDENMRHLGNAHRALRRAFGPGLGIPHTPLFAYPLPSVLSRLSDRLRRFRISELTASHVDIVYCGHLDIEDDELREVCGRGGCDLHRFSTKSVNESLHVCYAYIREIVVKIRERADLFRGNLASTLILSPLLWSWGPDLVRDIRRLLGEQARWREHIAWAGLPYLNRSRIWNWPVQRLRHQYWKLDYSKYATGHETSEYMPLAQYWAVGDTTSATRVYTTSTLVDLMDTIASFEIENSQTLPMPEEPLGPPGGAMELFVALDLAAKTRGLRAYTLLTGTSLENDYRAQVSLSSRFARTFHVEAARYLPGSAQQQRCLFPMSRDASSFTYNHGVVVSWCTRQRLRRMFQDVGRWWLALDPRGHIIIPVSASVLNIFRSGDLDLFPWDADIDANFVANHPLVVGSFMEDHSAELAELGYDYILRGDRVVIKDLADTARMDIWLSGPQEVLAYDIKARLCGVRVNFFRDQLEGSVWYYRPAEKIYGNTKGLLLHCRWEGHNACLPDCLRNGLGVGSDGCEFPDRFVHLDS